MVVTILVTFCLTISAFFGFLSYLWARELQAIRSAKTITIQELEQRSQTMADRVGSRGSFCDRVELKGVLRSANPLTAEFSQRPCVYYRSTVAEEYENERTQHVSFEDGRWKSEPERTHRTLSENEMHIDFYLQDSTGQIKICPNRAQFDGIEVVNRLEPLPDGDRVAFDEIHRGRMVGYRYRERIVPIGVKGYVLGEVGDRAGELQISAPQNINESFIITTKSEEELIKTKEEFYKGTEVAALFFFVAAVAIVICSFFV